MSSTSRIVMVMPTYNEIENLEHITARILQATHADILIVDDDSPDGTGVLADQLAASNSRVQVVHRKVKAGLGAAYLQGFAVALAQGYDIIGEIDADGSHQPEEIPKLLAALEDADLVIGARWVAGGSVVNWSRARKALSIGGNHYARFLLGLGVNDVTAGFRLFHAATLSAIDLDAVESVGYCFQADLTVRVVDAGLRVVEVPIEFVERERGESKMNTAVALESLRRITSWGVQRRVQQLGRIARQPKSSVEAARRLSKS